MSAGVSPCDIMRRSNCTGALQYIAELTWILFLPILDEHEQEEIENADAVGFNFTRSLEPIAIANLVLHGAVYDLKAVNPNPKNEEDTHTPEELLNFIEMKGRKIADILARLRTKKH
ncbi:MAG: hypothetical protein V7K48_09560 [Nostoc sp.]|uniref:hypothetical protein n=1 Tax=Nostoc sp. TaxID=1180 RepID=UPI002FFC149E